VAAAPLGPGFGTPTPLVFGNGFETDLRLDYSGNHTTAYEAAPQSLSSTISTLQRSLDGGLTWKLVPGQASGLLGGKNFVCPAGGGDAELDTAAGHPYYNDLTLANFTVGRSDDQGTSFNAGTNCAGVVDAGVDRPWYAALGDPTNTSGPGQTGLFLVYDESPSAANQVACPANSGNVLVAARSPIFSGTGTTAGIQFTNGLALSCDEGIMGNDEVFDYGAAGGGPEFYVIHDNAALTDISVVHCAVGAESVANATGLTGCSPGVNDTVVANFAAATAYDPRCPCVTGGNFPTMAVDNHGNLFAVWEETPKAGGDTLLYFSTSMNKGASWSTPMQLPTPGLHMNVFAWPGAGDPGRIDVAFYGAPETSTGTPDSTPGHYGLYMVQTTNNGLSWTAPVLASEHFIHYGTMFTLIGGQTGNRSQGDFLQLRVGPQGEANISYSDSNNQDSGSTPEAMFARQNSGTSLFAAQNGTGQVSLPAAPAGNCAAGDPAGANDATFDAAQTVGPNNPNLDLLGVCMSQPDTTHYQVQMQVADLTSLTPGMQAGGTTLIWQTQWHQPSSADTTNGGALWMVYAESIGGAAPTCWAGQSGTIAVGGGVQPTYPGTTQLTGTACQFSNTAPGTITITVPTALVTTTTTPDSSLLYSVTATSQTQAAGTPPGGYTVLGGIGGQLFNVIDAVPAFDFNPAGCTGPQCNVPEAPWVPLLLVMPGAGALAVGIRRQRRAGRTFIEPAEVQS
jgi:hypothetical protein